MSHPPSDPHAHQQILKEGAPLEEAHVGAALFHGRGSNARDMLDLARRFSVEGVALIAPNAAGRTWYPFTFLDPIEKNEPKLTFALGSVERAMEVLDGEDIPPERSMLLGFSQGGCLALEYAARNPRRYGAVVGLSAGLIGPPGTTWEPDGSLEGTPVFLGCSDVDTHIPKARVEESAAAFEKMGGQVDLRFYEGMLHTINQEEMDVVRQMIQAMMRGG